MEVPKAVRSRCTNVAEQPHQFVASDFALGKDMEARSQMLSAIGLLGQVQQPRGLLELVVPLEARSVKRLVRNLLDGKYAPAQSRMLSAIVAEAGEVDDRQFNGSPVCLPKAVHVTSLDGLLEVRSSDPQVGVDVLTLQVDELGMFVFVGLLEKSEVSREGM